VSFMTENGKALVMFLYLHNYGKKQVFKKDIST